MDMNGCPAIGFGGATCSGKSTLVDHLVNYFPYARVLHQDEYYNDLNLDNQRHLWDETINSWNWESLEALDMTAFTEKLSNLKAIPLFKSVNSQNIYETPLIFVDGFGIYNHSPVVPLIDCKFFLTLTNDQCRSRRSQRSYTIPDVPQYFDSYLWPYYLRMKEEIMNLPDVIYIDGERSEEDVTQQVLKNLRKFLNSKYGLVESSCNLF